MGERRAMSMGTSARRRAPLAVVAGIAIAGAWAMLAGTALAAAPAVSISGFAFHPSSLAVNVGDTVTWTNNDGVGHTATADGGAFDTGRIAGGSSASFTFTAAGTFTYHCSVHPSMTGSIVVGRASGSASLPPTDTVAAVPAASAPASTGGPGGLPLALIAAAGLFGVALPARRLARRRA